MDALQQLFFDLIILRSISSLDGDSIIALNLAGANQLRLYFELGLAPGSLGVPFLWLFHKEVQPSIPCKSWLPKLEVDAWEKAFLETPYPEHRRQTLEEQIHNFLNFNVFEKGGPPESMSLTFVMILVLLLVVVVVSFCRILSHVVVVVVVVSSCCFCLMWLSVVVVVVVV